MPFASLAQEKYLKWAEPEIYKRWVAKYGHFKKKRKSSTIRKRRKKR